MNKVKDKILQLRSEGKSYKQIVKILGCSSGSVAYHCGNGQKEKSRNRSRKNRKLSVLQIKTERFKNRKKSLSVKKDSRRDNRNVIAERCRDFQRRNGSKLTPVPFKNFTFKEVLATLGDNPTCYLSGRKIDLTKPSSYSFDHKIPASKGGGNEIENLGLTCKEANRAKSDLLFDELIHLCKDILENNGYRVEKLLSQDFPVQVRVRLLNRPYGVMAATLVLDPTMDTRHAMPMQSNFA